MIDPSLDAKQMMPSGPTAQRCVLSNQQGTVTILPSVGHRGAILSTA